MKSYTDIEQSKKLAEILPLESADMMYQEYETVIGDDYGFKYRIQPFYSSDIDGIPCWSLAALLNLIPEYIRFNEHTWKFYLEHCGVYYMNADTYDTNTFSSSIGILIDDVFEIILKLKENNVLYTRRIEEKENEGK